MKKKLLKKKEERRNRISLTGKLDMQIEQLKVSFWGILAICALVLCWCPSLLAEEPDAQSILHRVDDNINPDTRISTISMTIHGRRSSRTVRSKSWIRGVDKAFTEYLAPPREQGTKMLKLEDELWIYSPDTDRTIQISGHMLREPVMGSDLSYEDFMEDPVLSNIYSPELEGTDTFLDRECWVLYLTAEDDDVAYRYRRLWVDKERFLPLKEEWYGSGETLLKTFEVKEMMEAQGRWYPKRAVFNDVLKAGDGTEVIIEEIEFDVDIPDRIFSRAALRQ